MHFQPDPGEPAVRLSAKESESAGLVTLQEQRNETRLRLRALSQGEDIVYSQRTFNLGIGQNSATVSSGLTTVVTRTDSNGYLPDSVVQMEVGDGEHAPVYPAPASRAEAQAAPRNSSSIDQPSEKELNQEEQNLETEKNQLERNLLRAQFERDQYRQNGNAVLAENAEQKQRLIEREIEKNEKEKRSVNQACIQRSMNPSQKEAGGRASRMGNATGAASDDAYLQNRHEGRQNEPATASSLLLNRFSFAR